MTTDNVTPFVGPPGTPPTDTLEDHFGADAWMLRMCALWRAMRAQQQKNWAEYDVASGWGYLKSPDLDSTPLDQMAALECHIAKFEPSTVLLARELLGICRTILAHQEEDPESTLAQGPVLEIVLNVIAALESMKGDTRIGPESKPSAVQTTQGE